MCGANIAQALVCTVLRNCVCSEIYTNYFETRLTVFLVLSISLEELQFLVG